MTNFYPPNNPPIEGSEATAPCGDHLFWTWEMVEERLVEAIVLCWRLPDREKGWLTVRAYWPDMRRHNHFGDYGDSEAMPRRNLTRREVAEMDEALSWLDSIDPEDRRVIGLAITRLARGEKQVPWRKLLRQMGLQRGADGLRKRYSRAITKIANRLNGAENRANGMSSQMVTACENKACPPFAR